MPSLLGEQGEVDEAPSRCLGLMCDYKRHSQYALECIRLAFMATSCRSKELWCQELRSRGVLQDLQCRGAGCAEGLGPCVRMWVTSQAQGMATKIRSDLRFREGSGRVSSGERSGSWLPLHCHVFLFCKFRGELSVKGLIHVSDFM